MLFAVIGSRAGKTGDETVAIYPHHKAFVDQFIARGELWEYVLSPTQEAGTWYSFGIGPQPRRSPSQIRS